MYCCSKQLIISPLLLNRETASCNTSREDPLLSTSKNKLQVSNILVEPKLVNSKVLEIKQAIIDGLKKYQMKMLLSYNKLNTLKTDVSRSEYLDLIKNEKQPQAVEKLRSSDHKLRLN